MIALLTIDEAAARLRCSPRSVRRLVETGALPVVRLGRLVRIDPADLAALIYARKARPARLEDSSHKILHSDKRIDKKVRLTY